MSKLISVRWLVAVVAGVVVGMFALTGTAAAPPAGAPVRIVDADNADQAAHVDADGNLQIGGTVGIDSSTPIATTSTDDPGRIVFQETHPVVIEPGNISGEETLEVPSGKRLVITYVSGQFSLPIGQDLVGAGLPVSGPTGTVFHFFVPSFTGSSGGDIFVFSADTVIFARGEFRVTASRNSTTGTASGVITVSGYLINCEVASCNQP